MGYSFDTLGRVPIAQLLEAFNQAFQGYFLPINLTKAMLLEKIQAENIALSCSLGAFQGEALAGFILHGISAKDPIWYNAGTGVVPEARGNQLVRQMYQYLEDGRGPAAPEALILEVIQENTKAIHVYQAQGFEKLRGLNCYKGDFTAWERNHDEISIQDFVDWNPLDWEPRWQVLPTWQNTSEAILRESDARVYGAWQGDTCIAYIAINTSQRKIRQLYVEPPWRRQGIATALLAHIHQAHGSPWVILNVEERETSLNSLFKNRGMQVLIRQWEMEWNLNAKTL